MLLLTCQILCPKSSRFNLLRIFVEKAKFHEYKPGEIRMKGPSDISVFISELKEKLNVLYRERISKIILFGSYARNEGTEDSDIDIAVVLKDEVSPGQEIDRMIDIITDLNMKHGILISVYPVSDYNYRYLSSPLLLNVRREGLVA